ncbi:helix-turn-helix domain-containing protein [Pseudomonas sp. HTZ1]|uniref:helix-turn-helix domain-containing protein n=1 Tax=Pseudomonas sp. HTZ1 TaxID=3075219 RepID=UPI00287E38B8|nr:helix-turn-helix domain-containing protein [Pseudomonas sp. HTZ1]MDS9590697.1 helix-turn-helix domain-containing protein [Pseudomonas sp. HTZ1]
MTHEIDRYEQLYGELASRLAQGLSASEIEKMLEAVKKKKRGRPANPVQAVRREIHSAPVVPTQKKLSLSPEEAAASIGVARSTIYTLIASGSLPSFKVARRRLILCSDLEAWIARQAENGRR